MACCQNEQSCFILLFYVWRIKDIKCVCWMIWVFYCRYNILKRSTTWSTCLIKYFWHTRIIWDFRKMSVKIFETLSFNSTSSTEENMAVPFTREWIESSFLYCYNKYFWNFYSSSVSWNSRHVWMEKSSTLNVQDHVHVLVSLSQNLRLRKHSLQNQVSKLLPVSVNDQIRTVIKQKQMLILCHVYI